MNISEIKSKIKEITKEIDNLHLEISNSESVIKSLELDLKHKEEEALMKYIKVDDEYEVAGYYAIDFGSKLTVKEGDSFKITSVNRKSLYLRVTKMYKRTWSGGKIIKELIPDGDTIYQNDIKITSTVFYNNYIRFVRKQFDQFTQRNDLLESILN